jgi:hypothetical protein
MNNFDGIDFGITSSEVISKHFLKRKITTFKDACKFVKNLPYQRNSDRSDLTSVFRDNCGTCSTKHALLKQLAIENDFDQVNLKLGIFKMNRKNTPEVAATLNKYGLGYIPEAHNYLKVGDRIIDCMKANSNDNFAKDLLCEIEIKPDQISDFKINYHKSYLRSWLLQNPDVRFSFNEIWEIREKCITDLAQKL